MSVLSILAFSLPAFAGMSEVLRYDDPANCRTEPEYVSENLCVKKINSANMRPVNLARIPESPEVLEAAKVVAKKLKPYGKVYLTEGWRTPEEQDAIRATGVRAGPSSGPKASIHITGVAVDLEIYGGKNFEPEACAALNQILPMLKGKGGVIMEGYSPPGEDTRYPDGVTNMHIDDSWGSRIGAGKAVNYTGSGKYGWCTEAFGVSGASAAQFASMAKIPALPTQGAKPASIVLGADGAAHDTRVIEYKQKQGGQ
jgi:hypothetical protein